MSEVWSVPGFDVQSLVGFGATGEVWRARDLATGDVVALKRLRDDADPATVDALRREAVLLATLDTPYVVHLREVVGAGAGAVLVLDYAAGGSLAALLARRGALDPAEVVTVAAPLAQALAAAHERGLVHGDVTPSNVLFTGDGMPLLSDLGLGRVAGERHRSVDGTADHLDPAVAAGGEPDAAADVWGLAAVCHHMLTGAPPHGGEQVADVLAAATCGGRVPLGLLAPEAPRALVAAVEAALVPDPSARPDAASFASSLRRAYAAAPVRLTGASSAAAVMPTARATHAVRKASAGEPRVERRRVPRGLLLGAGLVALVVVAGGVGWLSGRHDVDAAAALPAVTAPPAGASAPGVAAVDWRDVLQALDAARAHAFAQGDVATLTEAYAAGSPALVTDTRLLQSLVDLGRTAHGLRHDIRSVDVLDESASSVRLRVVDVLAPYEVRGPAGGVVSRAAGRSEQTFLLELARHGDEWRLVEVRPDG